LGVSAYLQAQVRDNENLISMIPLCFTSFAIFATLIGFFSVSKRSYCGFTTYAVLSSICIIGFFAAMVATAMWLTEKPVLPDSLLDWIENHGNAAVTTAQLSDLCNDGDLNDVEFSKIDIDAENDSVVDKIRDVMDNFKVTKDELEELLGYCRAEQLVFDLLAGRNENTSKQTISIMLGICIGSGALVLDYLMTIIFGCAYVRQSDDFMA